MEKKKMMTVFLLVAVILIWGLLAFRIYGSLAGPPITNTPRKLPPRVRVAGNHDTFLLAEHHRDPFLSILTDTMEQPYVDSFPTEVARPIARVRNLPKYCGLITGDDKEKIAILRLDQKHTFLREGEYFDSMKLLRIKTGEIILKDKGEKITISFNN